MPALYRGKAVTVVQPTVASLSGACLKIHSNSALSANFAHSTHKLATSHSIRTDMYDAI